ncbi:porin [Thalassolituus sp. LLYu03]|uniref:porin n=1 Tax=Thalassolituus sp. LLYu03 TaxID=3421656 RepID=UPI003D2BE639
MANKHPIAMAVALAALSASASAAPSVDFYGFVDIGLETYSSSASNGTDVYPNSGSDDPANSSNSNSDAREFALTNGVQSRLGVKGSEDLGDGWTSSYRIEARINVLDDGGSFARTRLGWIGLSKGEHSVKVGAQWSPFFEYSGWNTHRAEVQGVGSYFYITEVLPGSVGYGYRNDSTINYTYGQGGFGNSPFTATVALHIAEDNRTVTVDGEDVLVNDSGITAVTVGGAATFGALTLNVVGIQSVVKESDAAKAAGDDIAAPLVYSLGGKYAVTSQVELGLAYRVADRDTGTDDERTSTTVAAHYAPTDRLTLSLGYAVGDDQDESQRQLKGDVFGSAYYQLPGERLIGFEFEKADYGNDGESQAMLFSARQSF